MTTMNGVVSVDRWVFGEQPTPTAVTPVSGARARRPADTHLRNLCASCHLGAEKTAVGAGRRALARRRLQRVPPALLGRRRLATSARRRPRRSASPAAPRAPRRGSPASAATAAAGASRSTTRAGRSSERRRRGRTRARPARSWTGATLVAMPADVHARAGLECVDCHSASEVMGEGERRAAPGGSAAGRLRRLPPRRGVGADAWPWPRRARRRERLVRLDGRRRRARAPLPHPRAHRPGLVSDPRRRRRRRAGAAGPAAARAARRRAPPAARRRIARSPARRVTTRGRRSASGATRAGTRTGTRFDLLSRIERAGRLARDARATCARSRRCWACASGASTAACSAGWRSSRPAWCSPSTAPTAPPPRFSRLFAPASRTPCSGRPRDCRSCHASPRALGFGQRPPGARAGRAAGRLALHLDRRRRARRAAAGRVDRLPRRAAGRRSSTREDARPFTAEEQRRVLDVGACLGCHPAGRR